ncbi:MAG: hemolysin D [Flavobacteriaceae bacterium]|nr:hemolysin D [Flavobacteriaceae bacterium]|tara:strand:- start:195523 stop:196161 length:639 start_codon:yes stop_codon:yes gene_type:complete
MKKKMFDGYSQKEEFLNIVTHGFGFLLSLIAFPYIVQKALSYDQLWMTTSLCIYGLSLMVLFLASTLYHASKNPRNRRKLKIFDHAAIYVLIAGSYSPFCLVALNSSLGWYMFIAVWIFALVGVVLKLFFTGRFDKISTLMYVLMGWQVVLFINPLMEVLSENGLNFLIAGGIFYTIGAILYLIQKIPYNHAIFHVFVLLGGLSHFIAIYTL